MPKMHSISEGEKSIQLTLMASMVPSTPNTCRKAWEKAFLCSRLACKPVLCIRVPSTSKVMSTLSDIPPRCEMRAMRWSGGPIRGMQFRSSLAVWLDAAVCPPTLQGLGLGCVPFKRAPSSVPVPYPARPGAQGFRRMPGHMLWDHNAKPVKAKEHTKHTKQESKAKMQK